MTDSQSPPEHPTRQAAQRPRRTALLNAARARFVTDGYAGTPVSAIVRDAGVAQGTFYLYFRNKQAVLEELRREVFRDYAGTLQAIAAREDVPTDERLARVVVAMAGVVERNLALEQVFRHAESAEATLRAAREGRARLSRVAAAFLTRGVEDGVFAPHEPALTASFIVTLFDNILYEALAYEPERLDDVVAESLRFVLRGVGAAPERVEALVARRADWRIAE